MNRKTDPEPETNVCDCCGEFFKDWYIERWCHLCRGASDCIPGRCGLPDRLPPDPLTYARIDENGAPY